MIPGGLYLADTSAIARIAHPAVRSELERLGRLGLLATCATVDLEVGYSARSPDDHVRSVGRRSVGFTDLPLHASIGVRALAVQGLLAMRSQHRAAGIVDLLTAAVAEHYGAVVLHYDSDVEHIAAVTGQQVTWVAPRGTAG